MATQQPRMDERLEALLERVDLAQPYDPKVVEESLYDWWETCGYFMPSGNAGAPSFVITMPPPNVTGRLHTGHAMFITLEDLMTRWHRMLGDVTLWLPGTDHAGIATQNVVEREIGKEGQTRHQMGRGAFEERVWEWKEQYGGIITKQLRRMGASCDWSRERFTLDEGLSRAVRHAFVQLYNEGLVYRGNYLVNWCPRCTSAISDLEVDYEQEQGSLWYIRYYVADETGEWRSGKQPDRLSITVATTRPETLLGDTAVAVHPEDERFSHLIGKEVVLPVLGRRIPILADEMVEREFGTGAVKITPGHDANDYALAKRHDLPMINIMNNDGTLNAAGGPYASMDRYEARERIVEELREAGNLEKTAPHTLSLGHCQRCGTVIEPLLSTQWFVKMKPLADPALESVRSGETRIVPEHFEKVYYHWLENIHDWCISRQLWWGHRIPVWYCGDCQKMTVTSETPDRCESCGSPKISQDEDVLDTWFSSGLWPFSTLGWPDNAPDYRRFYPTSVMETGYDILFFWVARMMMFGIHFTGQTPFNTIYLHGLVRDEFNRKMSKSLGNIVDPLEILDQYGTDALRFTLATSSAPGQDMSLQPTRLESARNFANKLWNITRFTISRLENHPRSEAGLMTPDSTAFQSMSLADRWIMTRFQRLCGDVDRLMRSFNFGEVGRQIESFLWDDFADWYLEIAKVQMDSDAIAQNTTRRVLYTVLEGALRLLHPFMPFVTEAAWQKLTAGQLGYPSLSLAAYPQMNSYFIDENAERDFALMRSLIVETRNLRTEYKVEPARWISATIVAGRHAEWLTVQSALISRLARIEAAQLSIVPALAAKLDKAAAIVIGDVELYVPLAGMVDIDAERSRLQKELQEIEASVERRQARLSSGGFVDKAPAAVVQRERDSLEADQAAMTKLRERLAMLG